MNLDDMAYFGLIAKENGITSASKKYHISKSLLSRRLKQLETSLGIPLVERTSRFFALTDFGKQYAQLCYKILEIEQQQSQFVTNYLDEPVGNISVLAPIGFSEQNLSSILPSFILAYPKINVHLTSMSNMQDISFNSYDIVITPYKVLPNTPLYARSLSTSKDILVCSKQYANMHFIQSIEDLEQHPIYVRTSTSISQQPITLRDKSGLVISLSNNIRLYSNNLSVLLASMSLIGGIALLPDLFCKSELEEGKMVHILPNYSGETRTLYALHKHPLNKDRLVNLFISYLEKSLR